MNAQKQLIIPVIDIENRIKELLGDGDTSFVYADDEYLQEHNPEVLELKKLLVNDSYEFTIRQSVDFLGQKLRDDIQFNESWLKSISTAFSSEINKHYSGNNAEYLLNYELKEIANNAASQFLYSLIEQIKFNEWVKNGGTYTVELPVIKFGKLK